MNAWTFFQAQQNKRQIGARHRNPSKHRALTVLTQWLITMLAAMAASSQTFAQKERPFEDIEMLKTYVQEEMEVYFQAQHPELTLGDTLIIHTGSIDTRLQLLKCDEPPQLNVKAPAMNSLRVTVKVSCVTGHRWTLYIPVTIETLQEVVVAARNLSRGTLLDAQDLTLQKINTAGIAGSYVTDITQLVGMELKRPVRMRNIVKPNQTQLPDVISKGETVVLRAKSPLLTVATEGTALSNGFVGEKIKVRNERSRRIIDVLVTGPGEAVVARR